MDIQTKEAFEAHFKSTQIYCRECAIRGKDILEFSKTMGGYFNIVANDAWDMWQEAKAQAVPEWISVSDRMPPVDETVLVCWDHAPDVEPDKEYTTIDENLDEYWPNCQDEPPTHWMPLPKVIEAQEQKG